ncbi:MAG: hypothetical protein AB1416_01215 [Actinomycetota bacterium]
MSDPTTPPPGPGMPPGPGGRPSFAEENAMRVAAETLNHYDAASDTYHCSYGPPVPTVTIRDVARGVLVRVDPQTEQVMGFSIPRFKEWHAEHAEADGSFEVDLPSVWPLRGGGDPGDPAGAGGEGDEET